jgi:hypothetical protein
MYDMDHFNEDQEQYFVNIEGGLDRLVSSSSGEKEVGEVCWNILDLGGLR